MEVNDYVRTNEFGIQRVKWFDNEEPILENGFTALQSSGYKSSPNIIDLIEVGDFVNYEQVNGGYVLNKNEDSIDTWAILPNRLKNENIKSVITREQMKSIEYKVKD